MRDLSIIQNDPLSIDVHYKSKDNPPAVASSSPEGTIHTNITAPTYTKEQDETWAMLFEEQQKLLNQGGISEEYLVGRNLMQYPKDHIPSLAACSEHLENNSTWQIIRVGGYVPEETFFKLLSLKLFPCTDFIRHRDELLYTPAPDMFHDLMGHLPLITIKKFASFFLNYGRAGLAAKNQQDIIELGRIYWHTVEFGLINPTAFQGPSRKPELTKIYGAGIASSIGEIPHALSPKLQKHAFDIERVAQTEFDIHEMQAHYFEIESFDQLEGDFYLWAKKKHLL